MNIDYYDRWRRNVRDLDDGYDMFLEVLQELEQLQSIQEVIDQIYNGHEAQLKQAYINGSNSTNELIQSLYKQIEQLKDNQCY